MPNSRKSLKQQSDCYGLWTRSGPMLVFVHKVLLEHSLCSLIGRKYGCFGATMAVFVIVTEWLENTKIFTI